MDNHKMNGSLQLEDFETPFADIQGQNTGLKLESPERSQFIPDFESPFATTFESYTTSGKTENPNGGEFVNFLAELHNDEFSENLYDMAAELENTWNTKISNEAAMGDRFIPFATEQANQYFAPVLHETSSLIEKVSNQFGGNRITDLSEAEVERFFEAIEFDHSNLSPAQEQFFGAIFDKVKSVVKAGANLVKKGVAAVGKVLPIGDILKKIKGLVKPLLEKVLKFAIGKLPKNLQVHAKSLAKKFLNLETAINTDTAYGEIPSTSNLEDIQTEFDSHIASLVYAGDQQEAEELVMHYETSTDAMQREHDFEANGMNVSSLESARQQLINELKELQPGQSAAPAIERFLPAAILALQPVIKIAITIIGREKVISFLAGLLAKLVSKYVPAEVVQPLASHIIDIGMSAIGFETNERSRSDLGYEAIANTIQETVQNLGALSEESLNDNEMLIAETLEAFEKAVSNNFPGKHIKPEKRTTSDGGTWIMMPRVGPKHLYKKYTKVFEVALDNRIASGVTTFRGLPLTSFLKDKLGIDLTTPVKARLHLYEMLPGTKLYMISRFENIPGLGIGAMHGHKQFHPLTEQAASLLLNEPKLGKDASATFTTKRHLTAVGQRFYYLEIPGAKMKVVSVQNAGHKHQENNAGSDQGGVNHEFRMPGFAGGAHSFIPVVPNSGDIQGVINFVKSEIRLNYYFSEEEAKNIAGKLRNNDYTGAFMSIRYSIRNVLHGVLLRNVGTKVKIVHEAMPEMFLEGYEDMQEQFSFGSLGKAIGGVALNAGKEMMKKLIEKLIDKIAEQAYKSVVSYFKSRVNEYMTAQAAPQDGVTIKIIWLNIPGMSALSTVINGFKGKITLGNIPNISLPDLQKPEVKISAGKNFD